MTKVLLVSMVMVMVGGLVFADVLTIPTTSSGEEVVAVVVEISATAPLASPKMRGDGELDWILAVPIRFRNQDNRNLQYRPILDAKLAGLRVTHEACVATGAAMTPAIDYAVAPGAMRMRVVIVAVLNEVASRLATPSTAAAWAAWVPATAQAIGEKLTAE